MKEPGAELNALTEQVIGAAIEVHRELGPGLVESIYEQALLHELGLRFVPCQAQVSLPVCYKGETLEGSLRLDLVIAGRIIVKLKAVEALLPIHEAQLLSYLKLARLPLGLLINFHAPALKQGLKRLVHSPA